MKRFKGYISYLTIIALLFLLTVSIPDTHSTPSSLLNYPKFHAQTSTGSALSGGKVYTYVVGTDTLKTTYSDVGLTTPNTNPVILNSSGDATIYLNGTYKIVLKNSAGVTQWTMDNVSGVASSWSGYEVDALMTYGSGSSYTQATIEAALVAGGTSTKYTLLIRPGTWVISSNADWSAYTNVRFKIVYGTMISHGAYTMTIPNPSTGGGRFQWLTGSGQETFVGSDAGIVYPEWWGMLPATVANCTNATIAANNLTALQHAIASVNNVTVSLGMGTFVTSNTLTVPYAGAGSNLVTLRGQGITNTNLFHTGAQTTGCIKNTNGDGTGGGMLLHDICLGSLGGPAFWNETSSQLNMHHVGVFSALGTEAYMRFTYGAGTTRISQCATITGFSGLASSVIAALGGATEAKHFMKFDIGAGTADGELPSDFFVSNCRMEYQTDAAIYVERGGGNLGPMNKIYFDLCKINGGTGANGRVLYLNGGEVFMTNSWFEPGGSDKTAILVDNVNGNSWFYADNCYFQTQDLEIGTNDAGTYGVSFTAKNSTFRDFICNVTTNVDELRLIGNTITSIGTNPFSQTLTASAAQKTIYGNRHISPTTGLYIPVSYEELTLGGRQGKILGITQRSGAGVSPSAIDIIGSRGTMDVPVNSGNNDEINYLSWWARYGTDKIFARIIAAVVNAASQKGSLSLQFHSGGVAQLYFTFSDQGLVMLPIAGADAGNYSIYVETSTGILNYKDSGGVSHVLY